MVKKIKPFSNLKTVFNRFKISKIAIRAKSDYF
jgi:hypothetical protein